MKILTKRVYDESSPEDGFRVLVDGLWPRGIKKENAPWDLWAKELAPSSELRKWYGHQESKWEEFKKRYWGELQNNSMVEKFIKDIRNQEVVSLLFANRIESQSHTVILQSFLIEQLKH